MLTKELLREISATEPKGDFIEFGVFRGSTFKKWIELTAKYGVKLHGYDSFEGMGEPSKYDVSPDGEVAYPKGKFDTKGGYNFLIDELARMGYKKGTDYELTKGMIPDSLPENQDTSFSFCYLDLDVYDPTKAALEWVWPRMEKNGLILCDDYGHFMQAYATKAIDDFFRGHKGNYSIMWGPESWIDYGSPHRQVLLRKH